VGRLRTGDEPEDGPFGLTSQQRLLTDLVALIRYELKVDDTLRPYAETVRKNFQEWVFRKQAGNIKFTEEQMAWLRGLRDFMAESVHVERDDLELGDHGEAGRPRAHAPALRGGHGQRHG
jgi:hypothetical protein